MFGFRICNCIVDLVKYEFLFDNCTGCWLFARQRKKKGMIPLFKK